MALTNYARNKILDHLHGTTTFTKPTAVYVGLYTSNPGVAGTGTEVTGGSYARQSVSFNAATTGSATNSTQVKYTNMPTATVTHVAILDAATSGNMLEYKALSSPITFSLGDEYTFPIGQITSTLV